MHASSLHTPPLVLWALIADPSHIGSRYAHCGALLLIFLLTHLEDQRGHHSICHEATLISCYHATVGRKQWQAEALVTTQRDEKLPRKPQAILRLDPLF